MPEPTFLWHDYETFGIRPRRDWPAQFAAIRTDAQLRIMGAPIELYCQPPKDRLPSPEACLVTGITPQACLQKGLPEYLFAQRINQAFSQAGSIGAGYNSIRFDDEFTRFLLWRNLIDPYAREWQNNCSRWDLIDVVRCAHALRPEGIIWPTDADGRTSFRLELLSAANGLEHEAAHDALSDVRATIALARLLREKQRKLFDFCLDLRKKERVARELGLPVTLAQARPFLHVSGRFAVERGCLAVMAPLAMHPFNRNELLAWDLSHDPSQLADLDAEQLRLRLFTPTADLPEGVQRLGLKGIHLNKSPIVVRQIRTLRPQLAERWGIDLPQAAQHLKKLRALPDLSHVWQQVYARPALSEPVDVDEDLYGGFLSQEDRRRLERLRQLGGPELAQDETGFDDARLPALLLRYRARNFPLDLGLEEQQAWQAHCRARVLQADAGLPVDEYFNRIEALAETHHDDEHKQDILGALHDWGEQLASALM